MINYIKGDITTTPDSVILHGVNCQGKFNAGVAKALRHKFPSAYKDYIAAYADCRTSKDLLGRIIVSGIPELDPPKFIVHCFTQLYYGRDRGYQYIDYAALASCLDSFYTWYQWSNKSPIYSVSMPKIGCGLGGGDWSIVQAIVQKQLVDRGVTVNVWEL